MAKIIRRAQAITGIVLIKWIVVVSVFATKYYVANDGSNNNSGTSPNEAWQTPGKIEEEQGLFVPGDSILFKCGDVFRGGFTFKDNGLAGDSIYISDYGHGNLPILTGAVYIKNWEKWNENKYRAKFNTNEIKNMFLNGKQLSIARYPNQGFYKITNVNGKSGVTSDQLKEEDVDWTGAQILVRTNNWTWEHRLINSYNNGELVFDLITDYEPRENWGFMVYNHSKALDKEYEWFYDNTNGYLYVQLPPDINPNEQVIEAVVLDDGIDCRGSYVSISNLNIEKYHEAAIKTIGRYLTVSSCTISRTNHYGIRVRNGPMTISNCRFENINGNGIDIFSAKHVTVEHCNFLNIGLHPELSRSGQSNQIGVFSHSARGTTIKHCYMDSTGCNGIAFKSDSCVIEKNILLNTMMRLNDGAAIGCFDYVSNNGIIKNNIIRHVHGCGWATENNELFSYQGIYLDNRSNHMIVENNTVVGAGGGFFGNAGTYNNVITNNIFYGNHDLQIGLADWGNHDYITGYLIENNVMVSLHKEASPLKYICYQDICKVIDKGVFRHNYYFNPFIEKMAVAGWYMEDWKAEVDALAVTSFYQQNPGEEPKTHLFTNETNKVKYVQLFGSYFDLDMNKVDSMVLQPFTSKVVVALIVDKQPEITSVKKENCKISFYPNPVRIGESIYVSQGCGLKGTISLISVTTGRVVNTTFAKDAMIIPQHIKPGIYYVRITNGKMANGGKLIIKE